jgi:hypothetical protein
MMKYYGTDLKNSTQIDSTTLNQEAYNSVGSASLAEEPAPEANGTD